VSNLARIQADFQDFLLREGTGIFTHVLGTERVSVNARLGIYGNAYRSRLIAALQSNYPALAKLLGERDFNDLATDYIAGHDSRFFSIRYYGHALAHFLSSEPRFRPVPLLAELARWEWTMAEVFDAADARPVELAALAGRAPVDWAAMRLTFHPSVRVLSLAWNAPQIWKALNEDRERPAASVERQRTSWLLWRHELREFFRRLIPAEEQALAGARAGENFGDICVLASDHYREDEAPAQAAAFLRGWIEAGLITGLS
jgi:hypothetical protein